MKSEVLRKVMKDKGETIRGLAKKAGVSPATVSNALNGGRRGPTQRTTVHALADALGVPAEYLISGNDCFIELGTQSQKTEASNGGTAIKQLFVGASLLNAKSRLVTEDTMEPEICVGDDVLYTEVEEDCQDMAKTKDIVFGIYKETGREALVRLRRDGDTMWGVIENRDFPGERQRELERITGIVVCAIKWYKRPSNLTNPA